MTTKHDRQRNSIQGLSVKALRLIIGNSAIVAAGDDILLYNTATGDAALAAILKASPLVLPRSVGSLSIRKEFPAFFSPGWSQLVATADPSF